ncbi:metallophosphoesterase [Veillonella caviae]|uniref:metallophosphoesterase n=1 Tax=Veillonella caviae TaxID=248316 RepID=UPI0023F8DED2|nr:metallophosphoesterase [Veillonella caviae]
MQQQLIIKIVFIATLVIAVFAFWALMTYLWKPKKRWPSWVAYLILIAAWFGAIRYYFLNQVELFGTPHYMWFNLFRTESYAFISAIFLSVPVCIVLAILYALVNRISNKVPEADRTGRRAFFRTVGTVVPLAALGGTSYAAFTGQRDIIVTHESFGYTNLPEGLKNYKIVQLSDIHVGACIDLNDLDEILRLALLEKPNRVVITGDLIDKMSWLPETCERLRTFAKQIPDGVDYILGNHEFHHDVHRIVKDIKAKTPINVLINSNIQIMGGKQPVYIAGVSYDNERKKENRETMITKALSGIPKHAFVIFLAHHPEFFSEAIERNVPLTLSGHTHGGQIVLFGIPITPTGVPYVKGRYTEKNSVCYVNNGAGHWFPIRVNCPREITVITFFDGK